MSNTDPLVQLSDWYARHCDGEWEHTYGIKIDTLDNPGWSVCVDQHGTELETRELESIHLDEGEMNWMTCVKANSVFKGTGDPAKLSKIIQAFLRFSLA